MQMERRVKEGVLAATARQRVTRIFLGPRPDNKYCVATDSAAATMVGLSLTKLKSDTSASVELVLWDSVSIRRLQSVAV